VTALVAIARSTLAEAIRQRILYLLLVFAVGLIAFSRVLSLMTVGDSAKIIKDVGLSAINIFGLMVALFVGVGMLFREMERRTVQVTLAGPVPRWQYLLGKYFGLAAAITVNTALMALALVLVVVFKGAFDTGLLLAVFMLWIELMFITAAAVFFSAFSTPIFSALFTAAVYIVGHLSWSLTLLEKELTGFAAQTVRVVYLVLPNLEYGDVRGPIVHGVPVPWERIVGATVYELAYAGVLLAIACLAFRRRDLV
jgi:ABC-type transport system involved in multi-copper enzyme maturation permease subunit